MPAVFIGTIRTEPDRQVGAFQIPGALPFSFKAVDAAWTIRRLNLPQYAGFGAAIGRGWLYQYVYTVADAAKFLRIYYARVKAHLAALDSGANTAA